MNKTRGLQPSDCESNLTQILSPTLERERKIPYNRTHLRCGCILYSTILRFVNVIHLIIGID